MKMFHKLFQIRDEQILYVFTLLNEWLFKIKYLTIIVFRIFSWGRLYFPGYPGILFTFPGFPGFSRGVDALITVEYDQLFHWMNKQIDYNLDL